MYNKNVFRFIYALKWNVCLPQTFYFFILFSRYHVVNAVAAASAKMITPAIKFEVTLDIGPDPGTSVVCITSAMYTAAVAAAAIDQSCTSRIFLRARQLKR